jgi:hypothetical protein
MHLKTLRLGEILHQTIPVFIKEEEYFNTMTFVNTLSLFRALNPIAIYIPVAVLKLWTN